MEMQVDRPKQNIQSPPGELEIDQSRAWDASWQGPILTALSNRIYQLAQEIAMQGIASSVENGNRMAAIQHKTECDCRDCSRN